MKHNGLLVMACLFALTLKSQVITLIDLTTREKLAGVLVFDPYSKKSAYSNAKGQVIGTESWLYDSLVFQLTGYRILRLGKTNIQKLNYRIELSENRMDLQEVVVSPNRWEEEEKELPKRVENISKREIQFQNPQTSADLLESSGYAYVQKSQLAGGSPMLRGFSTNRVLLVVDGVRMNTAIFRSGNVQNVIAVDANSLESAEILFGPGSVMYGSDAIGGVMDFHSLKGRFADSAGSRVLTSNAFVRYASANQEKTGHLDFTIGNHQWTFLTAITFSDYEDLRAGQYGNSYFLRPSFVKTENGKDSMHLNPDPRLQVGSAFSQFNGLQKIQFKNSKGLMLDYGFYFSQSSNAGRYDRLTLDANNNGILDNAEWYYGPQKWMMNRLSLSHNRKNIFYNKVRLIAALQNFEESRHDRKFGNVMLRNQTEKVDAYSLNLDFDKALNSRLGLFYGAEAIYNLVSSSANRRNIYNNQEEASQTRYPDGSSWQAYGLYVTGRFQINSKMMMNAGIRYTAYKMQASFDSTFLPFPFSEANNQNGALNGSLGFTFNHKGFRFYADASTGFRAPNIDDMAKVFESQPGTVVVPNPDLVPEYAYNTELGASQRFGNFLKIDAALFYTYLDKAISRRPYTVNGQDSILYDGQMSQVLAMQNLSHAYVYGLQAGIELYFAKGFSLRSTLSWQKGMEMDPDSSRYYPGAHVAPLFGTTQLRYARKSLMLELYSRYNNSMSYNQLSLVDRADNSIYAKDQDNLPYVPAWTTLNFKMTWFLHRSVSINFGVENITDQLYRNFSSGISAPGRNFFFGLRYKY